MGEREWRTLVLLPAVGAMGTRRTAPRCDRQVFERYSSRENLTGCQTEEAFSPALSTTDNEAATAKILLTKEVMDARSAVG